MDITITDNPYQEGIIINPNIEHKVAKLKNDTKRITIENYYNVELAKMKMASNTVKDTVSKEHGNDLVMGRLGIESLDYYAYCDSLKGARKLKVGKENVFNNVKRYYEKQNRNMIDNLPVENKKEELPKEEVVNVADNNEVSFTPHIVDTPLSDTRMSRLERTGEIPKVEEKAEVTLKREDINHGRVNDIINAPDRFVEPEREVKEEVEIHLKYEGYIARQIRQVAQSSKLENQRIPSDIDYNDVKSLRLEARQKLTEIKPETLGQASRISGVSPADISVLQVFLATR